jgi:hypothetical protein
MHVIDTDFQRLSDWTIPDLLGELGVYVLWDGKAKARPTYIGEGNILRRLVEHENKFARPLDGFVAVLSNDYMPWQHAKADGTIVEAMLLSVAKQTDRKPSINVAPGRLRALTDIFARHGTVRINVSGMDPLRPPEENPRLSSCRRVTLRETSDGQIEVEHSWRTRRQRQF